METNATKTTVEIAELEMCTASVCSKLFAEMQFDNSELQCQHRDISFEASRGTVQ